MSDGLIEQNRLLHNVADLASESLDVVVNKVDSVDLNRAFLDVVETQEEVCNRALSAARVTHQGDLLGRWNFHVELIEDKSLTSRVTEVYVFKLNFSFTNGLNSFPRALSDIQGRALVNNRKDITGRVLCFLDGGNVGHGDASTHAGGKEDPNRHVDVIRLV